jgi:hypothetical protein
MTKGDLMIIMEVVNVIEPKTLVSIGTFATITFATITLVSIFWVFKKMLTWL